MPSSPPRAARLLNVVAALRDADRALTAAELRRRVPGYDTDGPLASFQRAFERDKDTLRSIGVELEVTQITVDDGPVAAYRIRRERYELPDPGLEPAELAALRLAAEAVRLRGIPADEVDDALRKLGGVGAGEAGAAPEPRDPLGELVGNPELPVVFGAVLDHAELGFDYPDSTDADAARSRRRLHPDRLQFERGRWYVSGHDLDRDARRSFRVDRLGAAAAGPPGAFDVPDERPGVRFRAWEYGPEDAPAVPARVRLDAVAAGLFLAEHPDVPVTDEDETGAVTVTLEVREPEALFGVVLSFLERAELLDPPELRAALVARLEQFVAAADGGGA